MRARTILALAVVLFSFGCSTSPTEPDTDTLTGRWEGTFSVVSCEWAGGFSPGCPGAEISTYAAGLLFLDPVGTAIQGYGHFTEKPADLLVREDLLNSYFNFRKFDATLGADGTLQFGGGWGGGFVGNYELQWVLKLAAPDRLEGTLRSTNSYYKSPGIRTLNGTVVLTKTPD
jgi:hypothetical protein